MYEEMGSGRIVVSPFVQYGYRPYTNGRINSLVVSVDSGIRQEFDVRTRRIAESGALAEEVDHRPARTPVAHG